jgi:hypothetical protein
MRRVGTAAIAALVSTAALRAAPPDTVSVVAGLLAGSFAGSTPGNRLNADLRPVTLEPGQLYDLFLTVSGRYQGQSVRLQGVIRLERQGQSALLTYIPHFDPAISSLSADAGRFTERELSSACALNLAPQGDGFVGETAGTTACSFAIRGATGKWTLEIEPGHLRIRNAASGETLRFQEREGSAASR